MQKTSFDEAVNAILLKEKRYHKDAYLFLRDALDHTRQMLEREGKLEKSRDNACPEKHVTAQELLEGIRELALKNFGPMAITVFDAWGIHECQDFGDIVFIMVDKHLLKKTEKDSRADFNEGYTFFDAFRKPFLPCAKLRRLRAEQKAART
jgi:uncharacterized repeat protein (TIGR04138 family)